MFQFFLVTLTALFWIQPSLAAQVLDTEYPPQLAAMNNVDLSVELSKNLVASGWFCGGDYAKKIYDQLSNGQPLENIQIENKNPDCQKALKKLSYTVTEAHDRLNLKAKEAGLKRPEYQYSQFSFTAQVKFDQTLTESGNSECLQLGRGLWKKFADNPMYPPYGALGEQKNISSNRCEIAREIGGGDNLLTCSNWIIAAEFDAKTNTALLPSMIQHEYRKEEFEQIKKSREIITQKNKSGSTARYDDPAYVKLLTDSLNLQVNGGFEYQAVLIINLNNKTAKMELVGEIPKLRQAQRQSRPYITDSSTSCRIAAPVDANISDVTNGGIFFNRRNY